MECSEPGAIRDEELLAYLAGEKVRPIVEQHIARCQRCAAQLAAYERIELALTSKLYRFDCPPSQVLGEYQLGMLSKELTAAVNNHLSLCAHCSAEVATLVEFLENEQALTEPVAVPGIPVRTSSPNNNHRSVPSAKSVLDRLQNTANAGARRIIATLLPPQPRLAYQRDTTQVGLWPRSYSAEDISISIQVERETSRRDALQLIGFVTRKDEALQSLQGTQVQLIPQGAGVSHAAMPFTQHIDELGNFVFSSIAPATYALELQFSGSTIVVDQLPVTLQD
jgi:anti-sigma factor RsiW